MKLIKKIGLIVAMFATFSITGCNGGGSSTVKQQSSNGVVGDAVSEESLGLRKTNLYDEKDETAGDKTSYGKSPAGSGHKIARAFQDAPPMIPHDTEGMLPITIKDNQCITCHLPQAAKDMGIGATPVPVSHFTNFRPSSSYAEKGINTSDGTLKHISIKQEDKLQGARFNCSQCHAPQIESKKDVAVSSTFKATYTNKDGANKSSWRGSKLTDSLNTIIGGSTIITDEDLANKNSPAGSMGH